jgi:hypothetical protein
LDDKIQACEHLRELDPTIFGDLEAPADIKTFKRKGFKMKEWDKFKGSVKAGIEIVRSKIYTTGAGTTLFFLTDDPAIEGLFKEMLNYCFTTDTAGEFTDTPAKGGEDRNDALRYAIMNAFAKDGVPKALPTRIPDEVQKMVKPINPLQEFINNNTGDGSSESTPSQTIKKGNFYWDL